MAAVSVQRSQELRELPLMNGGEQARQLQLQPSHFINPSLPGHPPAAIPPLETEGELDRNIRWRVVCISLSIAVYVVINGLIRYTFDTVEMQEALDKVRQVTHFRGGPTTATFVLNMLPSMGMYIGIGMLVPLCGYYGVKKSDKSLVGCFSCCNALNCCCAIFSIVCLVGVATGAKALAPTVELYLERCDPVQCRSDLGNATADKTHLVDCLAAGMWKDYNPRFPGAHLPADCPPVFLDCSNFRKMEKETFEHYEQPPYSSFADDSRPSGDALDDADEPVRAEGMGDYGAFLASEFPASSRFPSSSQQKGPHQSLLRRLRYSGDRLFQSHEVRPKPPPILHRDAEGDMQFEPPPMPKDPIAECSPSPVVKRFHEVRLLVPVLLPQLQLYFLVRGVLLLPVMIFGCLGFCWGKELYSRLDAGYNPVGTNNHPQVMLHPSFGSTPGSAQMQMAQPLIVNAPMYTGPEVTAILPPSAARPYQASAPLQ